MEIGDLVVRVSYNKDIIFVVDAVEGEIVSLRGKYIRLYANANISDLEIVENEKKEKDKFRASNIRERIKGSIKKKQIFLTGKILHLDGDAAYLNECLELYNEVGAYAIGVHIKEESMSTEVLNQVKMHHPDIIVITGHDAFNNKNKNDLDNYMNTKNFINAVSQIRNILGKDEVIIIAGACGSNFEALIAAGANFATSPKRINVHAYDPTIVAIIVAFTPFNKTVSFDNILAHTYVDRGGIGGIESYGKLRMLL